MNAVLVAELRSLKPDKVKRKPITCGLIPFNIKLDVFYLAKTSILLFLCCRLSTDVRVTYLCFLTASRY